MFRQQCEYIIFSFLNLIVSSWALVVVLPNFVHNSDILCTVGGVTECHVVTIFPDTSSGLQRLSEFYFFLREVHPLEWWLYMNLGFQFSSAIGLTLNFPQHIFQQYLLCLNIFWFQILEMSVFCSSLKNLLSLKINFT